MSGGIVIAGGGLAAQRCCATLRANGYDGAITVICSEPTAPYDRPPLSKEVLAGTLDASATSLRPTAWYAERGVELVLGMAATALHADEHRLGLADGTTLTYDRLLVATGAQPRRLELVAGAPNAYVLRTTSDAVALRAALLPGSRLVVIGGGFIGQEVAATARGLGVEVTLLEAMDAPLTGILGHDLGTWFAELHRAHGVDVRCGLTAAHVRRAKDGRIDALVTGDGTVVGCDAIVVGVGVAPADVWLAGSAIGGGGVECDDCGRTALPDVYAAGDVARPYDRYVGGHVRSEHWEAAARQGAAAARAMLDLESVPAAPASFWSDQYGLRIQYLGHAALGDSIEIDGDRARSDFRAVWRRDGQPVAALLVGRSHELPAMRRLVQETFDHHAQETTTT